MLLGSANPVAAQGSILITHPALLYLPLLAIARRSVGGPRSGVEGILNMRKWKERELAMWLEARLAETQLKTDERLLIAHSLAKKLLESPEITVRFHSPARLQRQGASRTTPKKG